MISEGQQIGGYTILRRIGTGAAGDTYVAEAARSAERVAIKFLAPELSQKPKVLDRFFKEARAVTQLRHPGVATTLECFVHDGRALVVMELLNGETLAAYLRRAGPLHGDLPSLLAIGADVAGAMGAVHGAEILHRDLNPKNIFLQPTAAYEPDATVKIVDFGIVRLSQEEDGPGQTSSGLLLGNPAYMSPEQCRGTGVDRRSDIYALGCILYEAVCGRPPFIAEGMGELMAAHLSQPPEQPAKLVPGLSAQVNGLILRMLAKKPEDRLQTMGDVTRGLRACARALQIDIEGKAIVPRVPVGVAGYARGGDGVVREPAARAEVIAVTVAPVAVAVAVVAVPQPAALVAPASLDAPVPLPNRPTQSPHVSADPAPSAAPPGRRVSRTEQEPIVGTPGETLVLNSPLSFPPIKAPGVTDIGGQPGNTMLLEDAPFPYQSHAYVGNERTGTRGSASRGAVSFVNRLLPMIREHKRAFAVAASAVVVALGSALLLNAATSSRPPPQSLPPASPSTFAPDSAASQIPPTAEIDIQGLPQDVKVIVDGHPATPPIRIPRSPDLHRIVLRTSGGVERTIEVDGTRDRVIELVMPQP